MTKQQKLERAEEFVERVTSQVFGQKLDRETLRATAEKVVRAVDVEPSSSRTASDRQHEPA
jgi:hypothetical protein